MKCRALSPPRRPGRPAPGAVPVRLRSGRRTGVCRRGLADQRCRGPGVGSAQRSPCGPRPPRWPSPGCHRGRENLRPPWGIPSRWSTQARSRRGNRPRWTPVNAACCKKEFCGVIDRIGEGTAVIEPLATEEIAQEAPANVHLAAKRWGTRGSR